MYQINIQSRDEIQTYAMLWYDKWESNDMLWDFMLYYKISKRSFEIWMNHQFPISPSLQNDSMLFLMIWCTKQLLTVVFLVTYIILVFLEEIYCPSLRRVQYFVLRGLIWMNVVINSSQNVYYTRRKYICLIKKIKIRNTNLKLK